MVFKQGDRLVRHQKASRYYASGSFDCLDHERRILCGYGDSPVRVTQTSSALCNCANILAALYAASSVSYRLHRKTLPRRRRSAATPITTPDTSQCFHPVRTLHSRQPYLGAANSPRHGGSHQSPRSVSHLAPEQELALHVLLAQPAIHRGGPRL